MQYQRPKLKFLVFRSWFHKKDGCNFEIMKLDICIWLSWGGFDFHFMGFLDNEEEKKELKKRLMDFHNPFTWS
jgi:hypothetical protein